MDKENIAKYYLKIMGFFKIQKTKPDMFGLKSDWARYFEEDKYRDKNLLDLIEYFINVGVLEYVGVKDNGHKIYGIVYDGNGVSIAQRLYEKTEIWFLHDDIYDIVRNPDKGSQFI